MPGKVTLVGAGPGDPGLLTRKGLEALRKAEVVVLERARVCIPVRMSNSVLAVPPAKPGTTTRPVTAWGSVSKAW